VNYYNGLINKELNMATIKQPTIADQKDHVVEAANEFVNEGKKLAGDIYKEGLNRVCEVEENMKVYSDQIAYKVKRSPLTSVLVAGGIGYLLAKILK
jgi:hypothetical protein